MRHILIVVFTAAFGMFSFKQRTGHWVTVAPAPNTAPVVSAAEAKPSVLQQHVNKKVWPWNWYRYLGGQYDIFHMTDPTWFELDEDQYPDCLNPLGLVYCSIKAMGDAWIEGQPDLRTLNGTRFRPL